MQRRGKAFSADQAVCSGRSQTCTHARAWAMEKSSSGVSSTAEAAVPAAGKTVEKRFRLSSQ